MLAELYPLEKIREILAPRNAWHPYPTADERAGWEALPEKIRKGYVARGEESLNFGWPVLPAALFLDYARTGNRSRFQAQRNARRHALADLVLAECMEGKGRFVDQIANGVWTTCEETYWGVPAHLRLQEAGPGLPDVAEPTVDLFAAETSSLLAWTFYLTGAKLDEVSPLIRPRIQMEIDRRILTPLLKREDFSWMGFLNTGRRVNNWNPWINSNWLLSFLLIEADEHRRAQGVAKSLRCLDNFIDPYPRDGGCDEGPGYWGRAAASLFDCLEILESATNGAIDHFGDPLLKNMGSFIYKAHIHDRYFVNFADASALGSPPASILFRYGKRVGDAHMAALGAWLAVTQNVAEKGLGDSVARQLPALFTAENLLAEEGRQPLPRDAWFPEIQVMTARSREGSADGFFVAAKGGTNNESHNHNDVGNFVVFADGKPLLIDMGVEPYTAKNSGPQRYDIWTMSSDYHNLPQINGQPQQPGIECAAKNVSCETTDDAVTFRLDITDAYPEEACLKSWVRTVRLTRAKDVQVEETYNLTRPVEEIALHLMTACDVETADGVLTLRETSLADGRVSGAAKIHYDAPAFEASTEAISLEGGERLHSVWGPRVVRITLRAVNPPEKATWTLRIAPIEE